MDMFRCGSIGPKVCVVSVITDGKLPVKYDNLESDRKRAKSFSLSFLIIFTVIVFVFSITATVSI
jgi:predicted nucleic acid-binding Zn ribbon protein